MVRTDEDGDVSGARSRDQAITHARPRLTQPHQVGGKRSTDLVTVAREVIEQDISSVRSRPPEEVAVVERGREATPEHAVRDPELTREHRPGRGMSERVRRVHDVEAAAESAGCRGADEEIPEQ